MSGITLCVVLQAALLTTGAQSYDEAYAEHEKSGRPILVLVGADWCPACESMKKSTIPTLVRRGKLRQVVFTMVNTDRERSLANQLMQGGSIPQLILFRKKANGGWDREQLTGSQSTEDVEHFIGTAVKKNAKALNASVKK